MVGHHWLNADATCVTFHADHDSDSNLLGWVDQVGYDDHHYQFAGKNYERICMPEIINRKHVPHL